MSSLRPKRYDVFLSYNSQDRPAVHAVAERLKGEGLELYLEEWELAPGREFQPALAEGLRDSKTCVVFLGPNGLGPWQKQELQVAVDKRARDEAFHVIPVLLPGTERPRRGDVAHLEFLINASWVEFLTTLDDERAFRSLVWGITGTKPLEPDATRYEGICPYRGLEAFRPDDAKFFFGRENLTGWLISALRREVRAAQGVRFLGVLGPSGSGKSSVVLAGLVPRLMAGAIEESERWPVAILRPGDDPLKNLATGVVPRFLPAGALPDAAQVLKLADDLRADTRTLDVFAQVALHDRPEDVRLVVVVDQFEEVFTYRPQDGPARARFEQDRDQFFANLLNAAATPGGRVAVVLTMRSDFLGACAPFPQLSAVLSAHQELVGPMTPAELREAIERPAFLVGCEVEPPLTERLLADVKGQSGALPLLQFALTAAWKEREVRRLTLRAYTELGKDDKGEPRGIEGVLDHRANEIYRKLTPEDQDLCRRLFLRLVQPGEGTEDTKRRVSYRELLPDDPARVEAVRKLVQALASRDARLITTEGTDATEGAVEVAHEALIRGWGRLREWIDADRVGLRIHRQLTEAAREWEANGRESSFLYAGTRLAVAREWATTHRDELNALEEEFLAAGWRKRFRRKVALIALISVMITLIIGGWELHWRQKSQMVNRHVTEASVLAFQARRPEAIKVLEEALSQLEPGVVYKSLRRRVESALKSNKKKEKERKAQERDRKFVDALDEARLLGTANAKEGGYDRKAVIPGYQRAFREDGIDVDTLPSERAAELIRAKPQEIREALAAALDDWAWQAGLPDALRLRTIVRAADDNPWRNAIRDAEAKRDAPALRQRAHDPDVARQPVVTLDLLGNALVQTREFDEAVVLLRQAQHLHPHDFWINHNLAFAFISSEPAQFDEAIRYYTAAVALRPFCPGATSISASPCRQPRRRRAGSTRRRRRAGSTRRLSATTRRSASIPSTLMRTTTVATAGPTRRNTTRRSPTTTRRSASIPSTLMRTTIVATAGPTRRNTTRRSPTTTRRSASIPSMLMRTTTAATAGPPRRNTTRRSPTTTRRSASTPSMPWRTTAVASLGPTRRNTTRRSPTTTRRSASTPSMLMRTSAAATPGPTRRNTTRRSPTTTRRSASTPSMPWRTTTAASLGPPSRSTTRRSPTTTRRSG